MASYFRNVKNKAEKSYISKDIKERTYVPGITSWGRENEQSIIVRCPKLSSVLIIPPVCADSELNKIRSPVSSINSYYSPIWKPTNNNEPNPLERKEYKPSVYSGRSKEFRRSKLIATKYRYPIITKLAPPTSSLRRCKDPLVYAFAVNADRNTLSREKYGKPSKSYEGVTDYLTTRVIGRDDGQYYPYQGSLCELELQKNSQYLRRGGMPGRVMWTTKNKHYVY